MDITCGMHWLRRNELRPDHIGPSMPCLRIWTLLYQWGGGGIGLLKAEK